VHNFRKLDVWTYSVDVAERIYKITGEFPETERFGLVTQMRRSAVSIASNIAEGSSRTTNRDFRRFLGISRGSAAELETQVILAARFGMIAEDVATSIADQIDQIRAMLIGLATTLERVRET
jgi:four helix bundle protein